MLYKLLATLLFLLLVQGCASVESIQAKPWIISKSNTFTLYSTLNEKENKSILENLEAFRALVEFSHSNKQTKIFPTEIYVMDRNEASLFGISKGIAGYFHNQLNKNIIYLQYNSNNKMMVSTILHEYVHYVHAEREASFPRWFEEGTAEYLSGVEINDDQLILGAIQKERLQWLRYERWLPARKIINPEDMTDWQGKDLGMFYAQSWLTTFYLNNRQLPEGQTYSGQLKSYLNSLQNGVDKIIAFETAFDIKINKLNKTLLKYWRIGKFNKLALNKNKLLKHVTIQTSHLTQGDTNLMLAKFSASRENSPNTMFFFDKATNFPEHRSAALIGKAAANINNNQLEQAKNILDQINKTREISSELYFTKAKLNHAYAEKSKSKETKISFAKKAMKNLISAWKQDKTNSEIYYFYGLISLKYDLDIDRAVSMLNEAIYHNPSNIGLKVMLFKAKILTGHKQSQEYGQKLLASFNSEYHLKAVDKLNDLIEISAHFQEYDNEKNFKSWAISENGDYGYSFGFTNQSEADKAAIGFCISAKKEASNCKVIDQKNGESQKFKDWFKLQILNDD